MDDAPLKLAEPLEAFVEDQVRSGAYPDREAVISDAVSRLKARMATENAKLQTLRDALAEPLARMGRGEGIVVEDLDAYFDDMLAEATRG